MTKNKNKTKYFLKRKKKNGQIKEIIEIKN